MGVNSAADSDVTSDDVKPIIGMFVQNIIVVYWHVCFLVAFVCQHIMLKLEKKNSVVYLFLIIEFSEYAHWVATSMSSSSKSTAGISHSVCTLAANSVTTDSWHRI